MKNHELIDSFIHGVVQKVTGKQIGNYMYDDMLPKLGTVTVPNAGSPRNKSCTMI